MTNQQIETLIQSAEKRATSEPFGAARTVGTISAMLTPLAFMSEIGMAVGALVAGMGWFFTFLLWNYGRREKCEMSRVRAQAVWSAIERTEALGMHDSGRAQRLSHDVARIYGRDPRGETLPIAQAVRLVLVWKQQTGRLDFIIRHLAELRVLRSTLLEKQKQLRDLGDDNRQLERSVAQLDGDIEQLERNGESLRASCARLEAILVAVDAAARRRQLHREVGELTAGVSFQDESLELADEHLDLERQIAREIETFLQLERETDAHLREL